MATDETLTVEWSARQRCYTVRVRTPAGRKRIPLLDARSEAEAIALAPHVAEAAKTAAPESKPEPVKAAPKSHAVTVAEFAQEWAATRDYDCAAEDGKTLARYLTPSSLGRMAISRVEGQHVVDFIAWLKKRPSKSSTGGTLAPRTVLHVADVVRRMFRTARFKKLLRSDPYDDAKGEMQLPVLADKVPGARDSWQYAWSDVAKLVYDPRVSADRRVWNALAFGTGARPGELSVMRWTDLDTDAAPLVRLTISRARKRNDGREGTTKTHAKKSCPLVPAVAKILADWKASGWAQFMGREPKPGDLIVPKRGGGLRVPARTNEEFQHDCACVGVRELHQYVSRHTFITLSQSDGGFAPVVKWATHAPPKTAYDGYTRQDWGRLCAEIGKLRFPATLDCDRGPSVGPVPPTVTTGDVPPDNAGPSSVANGTRNAMDSAETAECVRSAASENAEKTSSFRVGLNGPETPTRDDLIAALTRATLTKGMEQVARILAAKIDALDHESAPSNVRPIASAPTRKH